MKRFALIGFALALSACSTDATDPSKQPIVFTAALSAANETSTIGGGESGGTGTVTITFSVPRDASGNVTGDGTWNVQANLANLASGTTIILSHIHTGASGVAGPVYVDTGLRAASAIALNNGAGIVNFTGVAIDAAHAQAVMNNPAGFYFNMHSPANPGGVVRGQLVRQQ
jgi:hypothetical protein